MLSPDRQSDALFPQEQPGLHTPLLDVDILDVSAMTLNAFAKYRTIRILTYSTNLYRRYLSLIVDRIPQHSEDLARPTFDWKTLPSNLVVDNESTPDKLVLDRHETQAFIGRDLTPSRWRRLLRSS